MTLKELLEFADDCGIDVKYQNITLNIPGAVAWHPGYLPIIWLDHSLEDNPAKCKEVLAEELGHIFTGHGNAIPSVNSHFGHRCTAMKIECKGRDWALKYLVPLWELEAVMKGGLNNIWDLSAYFEVSHKFMKSRLNLIDVCELRYDLRA